MLPPPDLPFMRIMYTVQQPEQFQYCKHRSVRVQKFGSHDALSTKARSSRPTKKRLALAGKFPHPPPFVFACQCGAAAPTNSTPNKFRAMSLG